VSKPAYPLVKALGLMSGTSLDGIDVALVETDGDGIVVRGPSQTFGYDDEQRALLKLALEQAKGLTDRNARPVDLAEIERQSTHWHVHAVHSFCDKMQLNPSDISVIGYHGQTVLHRPEIGLTIQLGDCRMLAKQVGAAVAYDLRAADMAAGGQGAPLVPVYHRALASFVAERPVAFVNIGGVANVTWIGADGALVAFDTGPGNALIDDWMAKHEGVSRDDGGMLGLSGKVDESVVAQFLGDSFFEMPGPKSLDRNSFHAIHLEGLSTADGAATLAAVTARSIAASRAHFPEEPKAWVICGGGRHNGAIMKGLRRLLPNVQPAEAYELNGDAMEAEAWAYLAVRSLRGLPLTFPGTTGVARELTGGVIVRP
jgi:anhydro-N-acetylmuramic acid kinase